MRAISILVLVMLTTSCGSPARPVPSPTPPPPEPAASITPPSPESSPTHTPLPPITIEAAGVMFQIEDAAVYSNCLTFAFAVRGFPPPTGLPPEAFLPPARSIDVKVIASDGELIAVHLEGDQAILGNEADGRIWLQQRAGYSLPQELPLDQGVVLELTVVLDRDFQTAQPLSYQFSAVPGHRASSCP